MKIFKISAFTLLLMVFTGSVSAVPILSFDDDTGVQDGTLSYDGNGGSLIGSGIDLYSILGTSTPSNAGISLDCINCELNFTTGANISEGPNLWEFSDGGVLTITGTAMLGGSVIASGTLVEGFFTDAFVAGDGNNNGALVMSGFGFDSKNLDLISYFGLDNIVDFSFASTDISIGNVDFFTNGGFSATVTNADFDNTAAPEPSVLALLSIGLIGIGAAGRRRKH